MENATKALLIAAGVLIVIVLIGVGMSILNSTDTSSQVDSLTTSQDVQAFNAQFTPYLGKIKGSALETLFGVVNSSNNRNGAQDVVFYEGTSGAIVLNSTATPKTTPTAATSVTKPYSSGTTFSRGNTYTVTAIYDLAGHIIGLKIS